MMVDSWSSPKQDVSQEQHLILGSQTEILRSENVHITRKKACRWQPLDAVAPVAACVYFPKSLPIW
jgi:hypothetical protein